MFATVWSIKSPNDNVDAKRAMEEVQSMSSLTNNDFSESIFEKEDLIEGF